MAKLSKRITTLNGEGSDGWEVFYRARAMIAAGQEVIELTIGEHDIRTHPDILAAMDRSARGGHTGYASVPGVPALRDAIAAQTQARTGVRTTRDNVLITPGGQAGLFAAHMALCDPGDTALFIDPYYATYPGTLRAAGARPHALQTRADNAFQPNDDTFAHAPDARTLLVNSPNNPTGTVYDETTWDSIARASQERDLWLVSDEVYDSQVWQGAHISPRSLPGMAERTLVVGSMSKSFAMTGSRLGWVIGPQEAVAAMLDLATNTTYGVPGFIQDAGLWALTEGQALSAEVAAPFRARRNQALEILAAQDTVRAIPPQGAMYLMLDVRRTGLSGEEFAHQLLDAHKIAVMPGESFGQAASGHLRIALTQPDAILADALQTLLTFAAERAAQASAAT
ncbi:pyridoxal phosphate-dependent aminotransferase [Primorskyibacter sp. S187A]|uniref:pyridoxal phosphate-dependent aminotransferase n=1 Tax=Primorskyibacter sp. S187A TaxID=3415130 RepID=UPI003C79C396